MQQFVATLLDQVAALSVTETIAVMLAVAYVVLAIRQNIWCWLCAGISTALFAWLFFGARLYMEALLNVFYVVMAIYGWYSWYFGRRDDHDMPVVTWSLQRHTTAIMTILLLSLVTGYLLDSHTDAAFPYVDSLTSWGAVFATFLVARKVLENWWYWFAIDATRMFIFWAKELELTALLYIAYLIMIPIGLVSWTRSYREPRA
jgi:nicotinamide mononucleotide transporter